MMGIFCEKEELSGCPSVKGRLKCLDTVLYFLRKINNLITRKKEPSWLLQAICNAFVESRGYRSAWALLLDDSGNCVECFKSGLEPSLSRFAEYWGSGEISACGKMAMASSEAIVVENSTSACAECPLSMTRDISGRMVVRIEYGGKIYGLLSVSIPTDFIAYEDELSLFNEIAEDIALFLYGIDVEKRMKRRQAFEKLVSTISSRFIITQDLDDAINISIADLGRFSGVDRCLVFTFDEEFTFMKSVNVWCAEGVRPGIKLGEEISIEPFRWGLEKLKKDGKVVIEDVSVMVDDVSKARECFEKFNVKSLLDLPFYVKGRLAGFVSFDNVMRTKRWNESDMALLSLFCNILGHAFRRKGDEEVLQSNLESLRTAFLGTIHAMGAIQEMRDPYTAGHQNRVAVLCDAIAGEMDLPGEKKQALCYAALVHDIGKAYVPIEILSNPGKLTDIEYSLIKGHSQYGYDMLRKVKFPWPIADIVLQHHERLDGSGYPNGLEEESISIEARILAVADVVESMCSHRPYRPGLGMERALNEISTNRGILYDSRVVDACIRLFREERFAWE